MEVKPQEASSRVSREDKEEITVFSKEQQVSPSQLLLRERWSNCCGEISRKNFTVKYENKHIRGYTVVNRSMFNTPEQLTKSK